MEIQKATGIVLSSRTINESDILCNILTREFGKRKFIFKGLKKSRKRPNNVSEPGTVSSILYYFKENKEIHTINEFTIIEQYLNIRNNLTSIYNLYFLVESVDKTTGFNADEEYIFNLLSSGIEALAHTDRPYHLSAFF